MNEELLHFCIDTLKLKRDVKKLLKARHMNYDDLCYKIGYSSSAIKKYMSKDNGSRYITASLIEAFKLDPNEYMKEGFKQ
jgi:hypothetical protein